MARVSLIEPEQHPELEPIIAKIRSGRRGTVINVYKLLLHTPGIAEIWLDLINAVRWKVDLDGRLREVVIIRMGHLTGAQYVLRQHLGTAVASGQRLACCGQKPPSLLTLRPFDRY